ncbi:MAG: hypothetical protein LBK23_10735, partial [Oscillospiraceae bacterium]|nr:hypothetical protein [Oscillospiraceae bacterium]
HEEAKPTKQSGLTMVSGLLRSLPAVTLCIVALYEAIASAAEGMPNAARGSVESTCISFPLPDSPHSYAHFPAVQHFLNTRLPAGSPLRTNNVGYIFYLLF